MDFPSCFTFEVTTWAIFNYFWTFKNWLCDTRLFCFHVVTGCLQVLWGWEVLHTCFACNLGWQQSNFLDTFWNLWGNRSTSIQIFKTFKCQNLILDHALFATFGCNEAVHKDYARQKCTCDASSSCNIWGHRQGIGRTWKSFWYVLEILQPVHDLRFCTMNGLNCTASFVLKSCRGLCDQISHIVWYICDCFRIHLLSQGNRFIQLALFNITVKVKCTPGKDQPTHVILNTLLVVSILSF